ncbi:MAG: site-specific integrase [Oscillospiraceae bacterium]
MDLILNYNNRTSLYSKKAGGTYTETPKTETSYRTLKLPDEVMEMLLKWKELQDIQRRKVGSKWIETDRVFTKWNGLTLDGTAPGYFFKRFCERTGMRYVSNHSMRHLNASLLINAGVDVKTVQSCLGHSMAATTVNISYGHTQQSSYSTQQEPQLSEADLLILLITLMLTSFI